MNKGELIEVVAGKTGLSKIKTGEALDIVLDTVQQQLKKHEDVAITGFGTFKAVKKAARTGRNPKTGASIQISAKTSVSFKAGKTFKAAVA